MRVRTPEKNQLTTESAVDLFRTTFEETVEACEQMLSLARKLKRLKPGSEEYLDVVADVSVCATLLKSKTQTIEQEFEEIAETLPD